MKFLGSLCILVSAAIQVVYSQVTPHYTVVIEVKPAKTTLKLYGAMHQESVIVPSLAFSIDYEPGVLGYTDDRLELIFHLSEIIRAAKTWILPDDQKNTPVYVWYSGGSRLVGLKELEKSMTLVKSVMGHEVPNPFKFSPSNVQLMTGEEEGAYSWLAVNKLLGSIGPYKSKPNVERPQPVGVLDMGGASTEISFKPQEVLYADKFKLMEPYDAVTFELYTQTYLMYGADGIRTKIAYYLDERSNGSMVLQNPCLLQGDKVNQLMEDGRSWTQDGTGDPGKCKEILQEILRSNTGVDCAPKPCAIGGAYQPSVAGMKFYATAGFKSFIDFFGILGEDKILHLDALEDAAFQCYGQNLQEVVSKKRVGQDDASKYCMMGIYITTLLSEAYGFPRDTMDIIVAESIQGKQIDWVFGALYKMQ